MKDLVIYIHGKGGNAEESKHYESLFPKARVVGFDYKSQYPWEAKEEFSRFYDSIIKDYDSAILIANSIGAYFSMNSFAKKSISKAFFISPIVDMEKLIEDMMLWANVSENDLKSKKVIATDFGEELSWEYLCYARENPISWGIPTHIVYGEKDTLTSKDTITKFAEKHRATLTVIENGEHWFHTDEQMTALDNWIKNTTK